MPGRSGTVTSLKTKIVTPRLAATRDFYVDQLGLQVVEEWAEGDDVGCILGFGSAHPEAFLEVYEGVENHDFSGLSLQFRTSDLDGFRSRLGPGVKVDGPTKRPWGSTYLYLRDPNGILVVVFEGGL